MTNSAEGRNWPAQAQSTRGAADTSLYTGDPGGVRMSSNPPDGSAGSATAPALGETFAALDAEASPGAPTWTHAGVRQAEAGFQDPVLGWVGVRADLSGGGVHAAVVPGSAEAAQELGRHMDGLHRYLAEQHTPVASLAVANDRGADSAGNEGSRQGTGQGANQGTNQEPYREAAPGPALRGTGSNASFGVQRPVAAAEPDAPAPVQSSASVHISVVA